MQYRKFGKLDFEVSVLGYGTMRFPLLDEGNSDQMNHDPAKINEEKAITLLRYAIDNGVNYIDTAYPYHKGNSESLVGKALKNGYREKVKLTTKMPVWLIETYDDFQKYLDEQLQKLDTDYIDFYILHTLNKHTWNKVKNLGVFQFLEEKIKEGKIKHTGFSFHDELSVFKDIVDSYDWDMCQIQLNYMDVDYQAGLEGLYYAAAKGIAVVVMEPLRGGKLVRNLPEEVIEIWSSTETKRTPADWALSWVWNHPEVTLLLSGMSSIEDIEQNIASTDNALPLSLTSEDLSSIDNVKEVYKKKVKVDCTECGYCQPCPVGVLIPDIFTLYNDASMYNTQIESSNMYSRIVKAGKDVSVCVECGECEEACPQDIAVIEKLREADNALMQGFKSL